VLLILYLNYLQLQLITIGSIRYNFTVGVCEGCAVYVGILFPMRNIL